jgi:hypothetical protein
MASNGNEQGTILLDPPLLRIWVPSCIIKKNISLPVGAVPSRSSLGHNTTRT